MTVELSDLLLAALGALISLVAYFLRQKDEEQARSIKDLYEKHHADAERLHYMELKLASEHYVKSELDVRFDKIENVMKSGFDALGTKFDVLSAVLTAHITREELDKKP